MTEPNPDLNPVFSIITVSLNSEKTIGDTIKSVLDQTYPYIEYIVIDGGSSDQTVDIVKSFGNKVSKLISAPDNGMYDALNKGIRLATGDIIGILNSDDFFCSNNIIHKIAETFRKNDIDAVICDVQFVDVNNGRIIRYYSSAGFTPKKFKYGFMPAHPGFYAKKELFNNLGYYKTDYKIAADYELLIRFFHTNKIRSRYLPVPVVSMRRGGISNRTIFSNIILNREIARACRENGIRTNYINIYSKYFVKIFEFFGNRNKRITHP